MAIKIDNRVGNPDKDFIPLFMRIGRLPQELHGYIKYDYDLDRRGIEAALSAVAKDFNAKNGANITEANIVLTSGARAATSSAILHVMNKTKISGRRVLLVQPGYNLYKTQFEGFGFKLDLVNIAGLSEAEKIERIRHALTGETLFIPICSPNNPTGEIYSEEFMKGLLGLLAEYPNLHILSDSIYNCILRDATTYVPNVFAMATPEQRKRVFEIDGLSKEFSYPGIRAGWLISDAAEIASLQDIKDAQFGPLTNISQILIIAALELTPKLIPDYYAQVNKVYTARMQIVHEKLSQIEKFNSKIPPGALYYWADLSFINDLVNKLKDRDVLVSDGAKFGAPGYVRINCGAKAKELAALCDAIIEVAREQGLEIDYEPVTLPKPGEDVPEFAKE